MAARALAALVLLAGCAAPPTMQAGAPSARVMPGCVLVDTDTGSDDMRAIAAVLGRQHVVAIVTTAGIASAERGATVMAMLAAAAHRRVPVLVGASSTTAPAMDWLPAVRDEAERMDGELTAAVPYAAKDATLAADVARLTQDCERVDVVQIAPWSSFVVYAPALAGRLGHVLAQGRSPQARPAGNPGFNCAYDLAACQAAPALLPGGHAITWVDVPTGPGSAFVPTPETFAPLRPDGLPGLLHAAMTAHPRDLAGTFLWDDGVAVYLDHPADFSAQGDHVSPVIDAATFKRDWVGDVDANP